MKKKFVIKVVDDDVYINGVKRCYGFSDSMLSIEEKIMISMAAILNFEPAELLNLDCFDDINLDEEDDEDYEDYEYDEANDIYDCDDN